MGKIIQMKLNANKLITATILSVMSIVLVLIPLALAQDDSDEGFSGGAENQQFEGFNLQGYTDGGEKAWDVNGDTADIQGDTIKITNVDANRYGEQKMNLTAETGTIDKVSGNIFLKKDVVITSEDGAKMETQTLDWQKQKDLVQTEDLVTITHENLVATGTGMIAHPNLKEATLKEDVTVNVNPEPQNPLSQHVIITSDGPMEIYQQKSMAVFNDNVVAIQQGRELKTDRLELYFDPATNQIKEMICIGNVEVTQGDNKSYSDRAIYRESDQKLVLTGRPKLILLTEGEGGLGALGSIKKPGEKEETVE
jgi:LPS export ABC transporter protein LptC/lipopolysaccharide transport protein LptA